MRAEAQGASGVSLWGNNKRKTGFLTEGIGAPHWLRVWSTQTQKGEQKCSRCLEETPAGFLWAQTLGKEELGLRGMWG